MPSPGLEAGTFSFSKRMNTTGVFLHLKPWMALITNVEAEHLVDTYRSEEEVVDAFSEFASGTPADGRLLLNGDDPGCRKVSGRLAGKPDATFGIHRSNKYRAEKIELAGDGSRFRLTTGLEEDAIEISVGVPGRHNVMNATAAAAAADSLGVGPEAIRSTLSAFTGVERRFEIKGKPGASSSSKTTPTTRQRSAPLSRPPGSWSGP